VGLVIEFQIIMVAFGVWPIPPSAELKSAANLS
jgi:hypothetical protein